VETKKIKILALDTSSRRGSVALLCGSAPADVQVCAYQRHDVENEHAERMLSLLDRALSDAAWSKTDIDKIVVGVGPGSFTGVRIGIAVAQGLMLGLGVPGVGVGSMAALAAGWPASDARARVVVRHARRGEYFVSVHSASGDELCAPHAIAQLGAEEYVRALLEKNSSWGPWVVVGTQLPELPCVWSDETQEPDARPLGRLGMSLAPEAHPVEPHYVRGPNLVRPNLPPSPLGR